MKIYIVGAGAHDIIILGVFTDKIEAEKLVNKARKDWDYVGIEDWDDGEITNRYQEVTHG